MGVESFELFEADFIFLFNDQDQIIWYYIQKPTLNLRPEKVGDKN